MYVGAQAELVNVINTLSCGSTVVVDEAAQTTTIDVTRFVKDSSVYMGQHGELLQRLSQYGQLVVDEKAGTLRLVVSNSQQALSNLVQGFDNNRKGLVAGSATGGGALVAAKTLFAADAGAVLTGSTAFGATGAAAGVAAVGASAIGGAAIGYGLNSLADSTWIALTGKTRVNYFFTDDAASWAHKNLEFMGF